SLAGWELQFDRPSPSSWLLRLAGCRSSCIDGIPRKLRANLLRGAEIGTAASLGDERRVYVDDPFGNRVELLERGGTLTGPL
ncbi:MAG: hypothetical protein M3Y04_03660, partial [Actinomycetota bacterium]|nr:hypothetical protein [Actinomycetota bacterium]